MLGNLELSFFGRLTLAKSIIQALPTYVMQSTLLPVLVYEDIDKACRRFIWGDSTEAERIHLVVWNIVCTPKFKEVLALNVHVMAIRRTCCELI